MTGGPIVFVHSSDEMYGADRMLLEMLAALPDDRARRAEVWLPVDIEHGATPLCVEVERRGFRVRHHDLPILRRALKSPGALAGLAGRAATFGRALRASRPSAVYVTTSAGLLAAPLARAVRVPSVVGHVQEIWRPADTRVLSALAGRLDLLVAISEPVRASLPETLQRSTRVVPNGCEAPVAWTRAAPHDGPLAFLVASRWNGWKGHGTLLEAWELAGCPGSLVVLGGPPPSGESVDVPALVRGLSRPESVCVVGEVPSTAPYVDASDVVLVPSDEPEPFGLVAIEAFARGRPVIASAAGGVADIVTDGVDGWLFPPRDAAALADLLARLRPADAVAAGAAARGAFERTYTVEQFRSRWWEAVGPFLP